MSHLQNKTDKNKSETKVSNSVKDYGNDPFFIKKADESKVFLEKYGFPKELLEKRRSKMGL